MHGERYGDPLSKRVCVYERAMCEKEGKQHSSAVCDVCRQDEAIQALVCSGWGRDVSLNDDDESAEASQGVRPRSWSCKGGCGGYPFKQASRRTIQGQTVRQPNESPAPPAMPDLTFSCISSPCSNTHQRRPSTVGTSSWASCAERGVVEQFSCGVDGKLLPSNTTTQLS